MMIDRIFKKHELKVIFSSELKVDQETFVKKMKEVTDINFRTIFFLVADNFLSNKIKYVGNFTKNQAEFRERTFPYKRFRAASIIKLNFKSQGEVLLINTSIQGISYMRIYLMFVNLSLLLILSFILLFELEFLPIVLFAIIGYFYIFLSFKYSKANVQRIKNELIEYYKQIEQQNNIHNI